MPYFKKNERPAPDPKIWDELKTHSDGLGGAMLDVTELDATKNDGYLIKGCPAYLDFSTKTAHVVKAALVVAGGTTSAPRVSKNHLYKVGDFVYVSGDAVTINAIDTSNSAYDVFTLSAACIGATAGAIIVQALAAGATPAAKYTANVILGNRVKIVAGVTVDCIYKVDQWVEKARIPYPVSAATVSALNPNIILK